MISLGLFVVIMDILKYWFDDDPVSEELERIQQKSQMQSREISVSLRFTYVNALFLQLSEQPISTTEETVV